MLVKSDVLNCKSLESLMASEGSGMDSKDPESPIDLSVRSKDSKSSESPLDLSTRESCGTSTTPQPPKKRYSSLLKEDSPDRTSPEVSQPYNGLLSTPLTNLMSSRFAGYHNFMSQSLGSSDLCRLPYFAYSSMIPWCFRLDINPSYYITASRGEESGETAKEMTSLTTSNDLPGSSLLLSGGQVLSKNCQTSKSEEQRDLNSKIKSVAATRRKRRHSPTSKSISHFMSDSDDSIPGHLSSLEDGEGHLKDSSEKEKEVFTVGPRVHLSVMSGGGLVSSNSNIAEPKSDTNECTCKGIRSKSGFLSCPIHQVKLPKLSIPMDPKDTSWISDYLSAKNNDLDKQSRWRKWKMMMLCLCSYVSMNCEVLSMRNLSREPPCGFSQWPWLKIFILKMWTHNWLKEWSHHEDRNSGKLRFVCIWSFHGKAQSFLLLWFKQIWRLCLFIVHFGVVCDAVLL